LSAYQLDGDERFLKLATDLGRRLLPAFGSKPGCRIVRQLKSGATRDANSNPAEIGTLLLELGNSRSTRETPFSIESKRDSRCVMTLEDRSGRHNHQCRTGVWEDAESHIGARIDSWLRISAEGRVDVPEMTATRGM
jgi:hypothetical protein